MASPAACSVVYGVVVEVEEDVVNGRLAGDFTTLEHRGEIGQEFSLGDAFTQQEIQHLDYSRDLFGNHWEPLLHFCSDLGFSTICRVWNLVVCRSGGVRGRAIYRHARAGVEFLRWVCFYEIALHYKFGSFFLSLNVNYFIHSPFCVKIILI